MGTRERKSDIDIAIDDITAQIDLLCRCRTTLELTKASILNRNKRRHRKREPLAGTVEQTDLTGDGSGTALRSIDDRPFDRNEADPRTAKLIGE